MPVKKFELTALVSSDSISAVKPVIEKFLGDKGSINQMEKGLEIKATLEGESAKELNRELLSGMRRVEKKTRIRSEWTSGDVVERFFDYVLKSTKRKE